MNTAQLEGFKLIEAVLNGDGEPGPIDEGFRLRLEQAGFRVGYAADFIGLSESENALVEIKLALHAALQTRQHAATAHSAQQPAPHDTLDRLVRELLTAGVTRAEIARIVGGTEALK